MNAKRFLLPVTAFALAASVFPMTCGAAPGAQDQVAASFERMLGHEPTNTAPTLARDTDPLLLAVDAVLWAIPSYHLPTLADGPRPSMQPIR